MPVQHHNQERYTHTTDGTNDYYLGIDGTNGFSITEFQGRAEGTFHILINVPATINSALAQKIVLEFSDAARTNLWNNDFGAFSGLTTLEYMGLVRVLAGATRALCLRDGGSISTGWHLITFSTSAANSSVAIDGVVPTVQAFNGNINTITSSFTATRLALMAATNGAAPYGCEWREAAFFIDAWTAQECLDLYNYYTKNGVVSLANTRRSIVHFGPHKQYLVDVYKGNVSGSDLLAHKNTAHDLTLTNF
jgi:hypothetical protein